MQKILVSACLIGEAVRYNGSDLLQDSPILAQWLAEGRVIPLCPEVSGGLPTPRLPAEISGESGSAVVEGFASVVNIQGEDVTQQFLDGARSALDLCQQNQIKLAVLTEFSPSCGSRLIHDGSFSGNKIAGEGVTAALLRSSGIAVYSQNSFSEAQQYLLELEGDQ